MLKFKKQLLESTYLMNIVYPRIGFAWKLFFAPRRKTLRVTVMKETGTIYREVLGISTKVVCLSAPRAPLPGVLE